jgi:hypothetical protein
MLELAGQKAAKVGSTHTLLLALMVGMDALWIYAMGRLGHMVLFPALPGVFQVPEPLVLAALEGSALVITALLLRVRWLPLSAARALLGVAGLAAVANYMILTNPLLEGQRLLEWLIKAAFATMIALVAWTVGSTRYSERVSFSDVYGAFRLGLIIMALAAVLGAPLLFGSRGAAMLQDLGTIPVWFFVWALAALGVAHREQVREEGGEAPGGGVSWSVMVGASLGLVILGGLITGAVGGDTLVQLARGAFVAIILVVSFPFFVIVSAVLWLVGLLFGGLFPDSGPGRSLQFPTTRDGRGPFDFIEDIRRQAEGIVTPRPAGDLPFDLVTIATWIAALVLSVAVIWFASRGLKRARREREVREGQGRESFGSWGLLLKQIRDMFKRPSKEERTPEDDLAGLRGKAEWSGTLLIREIYALLQKRAADAGYPRPAHQTPGEYLQTLSSALPQVRSDLGTLTLIYIHARYNALPISASAPSVRAATQAWKRIEPMLSVKQGDA